MPKTCQTPQQSLLAPKDKKVEVKPRIKSVVGGSLVGIKVGNATRKKQEQEEGKIDDDQKKVDW